MFQNVADAPRRAARTVIGSPPSNCVLFQFNFESDIFSAARYWRRVSARWTLNSIGRGTYGPGYVSKDFTLPRR